MKRLLKNGKFLQILNFIILLLNVSPGVTLEMSYLKGDHPHLYDSGFLHGCLCLRWTNWINLGDTIDLVHLPQTYESLANFGKIAAHHEQIDICTVPVSSDCRIFVKDSDPNYPDDRYMACPQVKHIYGTEYGWVQMRFLCWDHTCSCLEWSKWYNYDGPKDDGDVEILGKTISYLEWPCPDGTSVFDVECRTANGKHLSETNNKMLKCDLEGFQCLNDFQNEHCVCEDFMVRFLCLRSFKKEIHQNVIECGRDECHINTVYEEPNKPSNVIEITTEDIHYPSPPEKIHGYGPCFFPKQCPKISLWQLAQKHLACSENTDTSKCVTLEKPKEVGHNLDDEDITYPWPPQKIHGYGPCFFPKQCPELNLFQLAEFHRACSKSDDTSKCDSLVKPKQFVKDEDIAYPWPPKRIHGYGHCLYPKTCPELNLMELGKTMQKVAKKNMTTHASTVKITKITATATISKPQFDQTSTKRSKIDDYRYYGYIDNERKVVDESSKKLSHEEETIEFVSHEGGPHYGRSFGRNKGKQFVTESYASRKEPVFARPDRYYATGQPQSYYFNTPPPRYESATERKKPIGPKVVYDKVITEYPVTVDVTKYRYQPAALEDHDIKVTEEPRFVNDVSNEDEVEKAKQLRKPNTEVVKTEDGEELIVEALPGKAQKPIERPPVETYGGPRREPPMGRKPFYQDPRPRHYLGFIEKRPQPVHFYPQIRRIRPYPGYHPQDYYRQPYEQYYERPPPPPRNEPPRYGQRDGLYKRRYRVRNWHENKDSTYRINRRPIRQGYDNQGAYKRERYEDVVYYHDRPYVRH